LQTTDVCDRQQGETIRVRVARTTIGSCESSDAELRICMIDSQVGGNIGEAQVAPSTPNLKRSSSRPRPANPFRRNNVIRRQVFPACAALGLKRVTWLTLRRTYSSWAHQSGVPAKVVAQLMGHAKIERR
jgi:integrase